MVTSTCNRSPDNHPINAVHYFRTDLGAQGAMAAQEIAKLSPDLGNTFSATIRVLGLSYLVVGVLYAAIAATAYRKGEMWAWYSFWILPVFDAADIANNLSIGGSAWTIDAIGLAAVLVTLLISPQFETILHRGKEVVVH
ncbi:MAG TPA: hypothetical protein VFE98_05230 [Candidatus Bathyarchaeia archaeon]|nr:hypothetical protein [Candidatus Bathyarchaeia archaeon]